MIYEQAPRRFEPSPLNWVVRIHPVDGIEDMPQLLEPLRRYVQTAGVSCAPDRLPKGLVGITRLHTLLAEHVPADWVELPAEQVAAQVVVGIETDRGPWVWALRAAGYQVYAINPLSAARYRQRHSTSGAKSDAGDAHVLAEIVRLDRDHHRPVAGDSDLADAVKLLARAHQTAVWERTRHVLRLRSVLLEFFPAAVEAYPDLVATDALRLLARAPDPARAATLSRAQLVSGLRARRHHVEAKADTCRRCFALLGW